MNARLPIHAQLASLESEASILSALLLDNSAFDRVSDRLRPEHFTSDTYREIFTEVARQLSGGKSCDVVTVFQAMGGKVEL